MAQTLEEFLVSVKYNVDAPSQATFFDAMKKAATSVAGVAGAMTGVSLAILKLSDTMAQAGEKLYWMSQRVGDSVTEIQGMSFALSNLGISAGDATAGIERFGAWTRNMGPAATGYLRSLGVTATDTVGRMRQLGEYFRTHGGTVGQQGSIEYAIALRQAQMMGLDERAMLALTNPNRAEMERQGGIIQRLVWGKDWQSGPQEFAKQSVQVMNQFRVMGFFFSNLEERFGLKLFNAVLPGLGTINQTLQGMLPKIEQFLDHLISYAPAAMSFLNGAIKVFGFVIEMANSAMTSFDELPKHLQTMVEALLVLPGALRLIGSPLFWILGGLTALILLLDDYRGYLDDLKHPGEKPTAFLPWDKISDMAKPFLEMGKSADDFIEKWTGIKHGVEWMIGIGLVGLVGGFAPVIAAAAAIAAIFWGPAGIIAGIAIAGAGLKLAGMEEEQLANEAKAAGYKIIDPGDPANAIPATWADPSGKPIEPDEMARRLGHKHGYVTPFELDFQHLKEQYGPPLPTYEDFPDPQKGYDSHLPNPLPGRPSAGGQTDLSWWRKLLQGPTRISPGSGGTGRPGMGGAYQLASFGGFGSDTKDEFFTPERFYLLFMTSFADTSEKLGDILTTLTAMAGQMGVDKASLPGGGGGAGSTGQLELGGQGATSADQLMKDVMEIWGVDQKGAAPIVSAIMRESGGKANVSFGGGPYQHGTDIAVGYFQHTGSRHRALEAWAAARGLNPAEGRTQLMFGKWEADHEKAYAGWRNAIYSDNPEAFGDLFESGGVHSYNHGNYTDWLRHRPLGADGGPSSAPSSPRGARGGADPFQGITNTTNISVTAPNPASAAAQTVEAQNRVFEHHIRYAKGTLLA